MSNSYRFTLHLKVDDPAALTRRAQAQALAEGLEAHDVLDQEGNPNIPACLVMLLDPGSIDGCSVFDSHAEADT